MSDDTPDPGETFEEGFMRSAFEPFKFEPIVRAAESAEMTMARLDARASIVFEPCGHCGATYKEIHALAGPHTAVGFNHEPGCPQAGAED